jgi:hypothetical protein
VKLSPRYGSHLLVLVQALAHTRGRVLELGAGLYSTPLLHAICALEGRQLVTLEDHPDVYRWAMAYQGGYHTVVEVRDWDRAGLIDFEWDVALVDHSPSARRVADIRRLAARTGYLVLHDSNGRYDHHYHYSEIYPLFQYKLDFTAVEPSTTVLSNRYPLADFWTAHPYKSVDFGKAAA